MDPGYRQLGLFGGFSLFFSLLLLSFSLGQKGVLATLSSSF
jgi:hypothetical protein